MNPINRLGRNGGGWRRLLVWCALALPLVAQQNTNELNVGVRTQVDPAAKFEKKKKGGPEKPKLRLYAILQVQLLPTQEKLVKPVDAEMIARELARQLDVQGFQRTQPKQKPEIVITAEYGRGMLPNPYLGGASMVHDIQGDAPTVTLGQDALKQMMAEKAPGIEAKIQKASYEKLFIEVKAWKYPSSPTEKPRVMWTTLMNVDDPDHRDLNGIYKEMFAAGAPYFDRAVEEAEVDVYKALPEGNVKVGTPTEVGPTQPPGK